VAGHRAAREDGAVTRALGSGDRRRPERGRIGVEPEDDPAAALLYERREPVAEVPVTRP
jgi:hypothetical protein